MPHAIAIPAARVAPISGDVAVRALQAVVVESVVAAGLVVLVLLGLLLS